MKASNMRKILIICDVLLFLAIIIPSQFRYSDLCNMSFPGTYVWYWHYFMYGDFNLILIESSKIILVIVLTIFLITKTRIRLLNILLLIVALLNFSVFYITDRLNLLVPQFWADDPFYNTLSSVIPETKQIAFFMYLFIICLFAILGLTLQRLRKRYSKANIITLSVFCSVFFLMYFIPVFGDYSILKGFSQFELKFSFNINAFYLFYAFFGLSSLIGIKYRTACIISLIWFILAYMTPYDYRFIYPLRYAGYYLYIVKESLMFVIPLYFITAISVVLWLTFRKNHSSEFAQPEIRLEVD